MSLMNQLHKGDLDLESLNYSIIVLIPKFEAAFTPNDFKPISLLNGIFKIIIKVLANKLRPFMIELIGDFQTTFLKGRFTLGCVAMT